MYVVGAYMCVCARVCVCVCVCVCDVGVALLINNITGPGVPGLPNMFAEAGWLTPTVIFILIWLMSRFVAHRVVMYRAFISLK